MINIFEGYILEKLLDSFIEGNFDKIGKLLILMLTLYIFSKIKIKDKAEKAKLILKKKLKKFLIDLIDTFIKIIKEVSIFLAKCKDLVRYIE